MGVSVSRNGMRVAMSRNIHIKRTAGVGSLSEDVVEDTFVLPAFAFVTGFIKYDWWGEK